jgi:Cu+-exporting ATPase
MATDPICGMYVDENTATIKKTVNHTTYSFCSNNCLVAFEAPEKELRRLKFEAFFGGVFAAIAMALFLLPGIPYHEWIAMFATAPVQFVIGRRFYAGTWDGLKSRSANMDTLIALGTSAAWFYSAFVTFTGGDGVYFEVAAIIIAATVIGKYLEEIMKHRATAALHKLMDLRPKTARVLVNGKETEKPISEVKVEEICVIKPGETVPTDGVIVEGHSEVNESMVTGESMPVPKGKGDEVIGGTLNESGLLNVKATKVGEDTVLSQIIALVGQAQLQKIPIQHLVDRISAKFVPTVIVVALLSALLWFFTGQVFIFALTIAISVLIIACPCALGLATPTALVIGIGKAAEQGILVRAGSALELAKNIDTIVFDKTGTLTKGKPEVTDVYAAAGTKKEDVLKSAAIAERGSEHPLGKAVVAKAESEDIKVPQPKSVTAKTGKGIVASYGKKSIAVGNRELMRSLKINVAKAEPALRKYENQAKTAVFVAVGRKAIGVIALADALKDTSIEAVQKLQRLGKELVLLTGDHETVARQIAESVGITSVISDVKPEQKVGKIKELQSQGKKVCMVGDGINDAPALAQADLGIAIGSGTDVAKETGQIVLIKDDLRDVARAIEISGKTIGKIKQNLFWAFAYNVAAIPIAAGVLYPSFGLLLSPLIASIAMATSSITVVGNSLLMKLKKF